jgi:hypothetical protein
MLMDAGTAPDHFCSFIEIIVSCDASVVVVWRRMYE